jgi:hypothetical protein
VTSARRACASSRRTERRGPGREPTRRFSAFCRSAAVVKLNEPVMTVSSSTIITLLWAMAWAHR